MELEPCDDHIAVPRLAGREVANDIEALAPRRVRSVSANLLRSATGKSGRATSMTDDADLGIARGDFGRGEIARRHVVVIPEIQMNGLAAREQLPDLRREDAEMGAPVGRRFRTGMPGQNVQHAHAELAVLILLAPDARRRVHQRRERAIGAAQRPDAGELLRIDAGALADQADGGRRRCRLPGSPP